MSAVSNPNENITKQDLADFYQLIYPCLCGVHEVTAVVPVNPPTDPDADGSIWITT